MLKFSIEGTGFHEVIANPLMPGETEAPDIDISVGVSVDEEIRSPHVATVTYEGKHATAPVDGEETIFKFVCQCWGTVSDNDRTLEAGEKVSPAGLTSLVHEALSVAHPQISQLSKMIYSVMLGTNLNLPVAAPPLDGMRRTDG